MLSALLVTTLLGAGPDVGGAIREVRRAFIVDGEDLVSATATHRVVSHPDGSLELQGPQPLRFSLQSVSRSRGPSCRADVLSRQIAPGAARTVLTRRACALEETWTNEAGGLEHALRLQSAPRGSGGLRLRLSVEGPWHHQDATGHVFQGPGAAEALRYGNAFVVRDGRRLPIPVVRVEGGLELRVPAALLDAPGAFPMVIDPMVSMEQALDSNVTSELLSSLEVEPALAVDGAGHALVAWTDNRRQIQTDIFGARFDRNGLVDQTGLPLVTDPGHQRHPALSWDGTSFLLAWEQELLDGGQVLARTVSPMGTTGATAMLTPGTEPVLAGVADGGYSLLGWVDELGQVKVGRVGAPLQLMTFPAINSTVGARSTRPALAANARAAFVAWERSGVGARAGAIQGRWVNGTAVLDLSPMAPDARGPAVALLSVGGEDQAVVYWDEPPLSVGGSGVRGTQVTTVPSFGGTTPAVVRTSEAPGGGVLGFVGPLGAVNFKDLDAGSTFSTSMISAGRPAGLALASSGGTLFAVWTEGAPSDMYSVTATLPLANTSTNGGPLSIAATMQLRPNVALQGPKGLAVWIDGVSTIAAAKVEVNADAVAFRGHAELVNSAAVIEQLDLAAGPGELSLLTWRQSDLVGSATWAQLLSADQTLGPAIKLSGKAVAGPAVAWDQLNGRFVIAWIDQPLIGAREVVTTTVTGSGGVGAQLSTPSAQSADVDLTCLGTGSCLLAWEVRGPGAPAVNSVVLGAGATAMRTIPSAAEPAVSHDGTDFFMGWRTGTGLSFARVDPATGEPTVLSFGIAAAPNSVLGQLSLAPAKPPVVTWVEAGLDASRVRLQQLGQDDVTPLPEGQFPVVATNELPGPQGVVVYQRYEPASNLRAIRAFGTSFTFPFDAGFPDAGVDAGVDAGLPGTDGGVDAGEVADAGVMTFQTSGCGCHSVDLAPLLLLALAALRRRRRG